ncbi:MAG: hypothetical protein IKE92_05075 [Clostridiales bacterium]|nr:hypothetical protein [Clostridiales bacterium]
MRRNVKALSVMIVLILSVFCFTGCLRFRTTVSISNTGKADLAVIYAYHKDLLGDEGQDSLDKIAEAFEDEDWTVEEYKKGDYQGCIFTMDNVKVTDFEDVFNSGAFEALELGEFDLTKKGSTYSISWETNAYEGFEDEGISASDLSAYGGFMEVVFELPSPAQSENATDVSADGKKLTWDLFEEDEVELTFTLLNMGLIITVAVIVASLLIIAAVIVIIIALKKRKPVSKAKAKASNDAPVVPSGPVSSPAPSNPIDFTSPIPGPVTIAPMVPAAYLPEQPADKGNSAPSDVPPAGT